MTSESSQARACMDLYAQTQKTFSPSIESNCARMSGKRNSLSAGMLSISNEAISIAEEDILRGKYGAYKGKVPFEKKDGSAAWEGKSQRGNKISGDFFFA